ncbi:MAG TPA: winged helix-turn-helix domain-containing protein, partial [Casimicrobiaceae bacterium]|nr:winged helix-turn-helix domain-containing protein [Casimicrobiaceae bacterium]
MGGIYDIGPFRLDADVGVLTRDGATLTLGARGARVLTVLVEHVHEFVSKERLIELAWPDVIVEESNLPVQIHAIRRVLGQASGGEQWIETLPKRGYRFAGPVSAAADEGSDSKEATRSNLPQATTSFVGREADLVEIKRLLPIRRLITIIGVGGIGKTRLALQAANEVISAYRDGAWFVDLGALRDGAMVPRALAQVLGVQERAGKPLINALCAHLRRLQTLVILDNCEHLLAACADVADAVLEAAARTTIVATSRESLRVAGEQVYPLQPLSLPDPGASMSDLQRSDAVQLLVARVRQQLPDFELTSARASAVAELCIHLDGIPLALELAAARARSLSVEQINARLGNRFRVLTGSAHGALPRQQTLRATLDWSYDLLGEDERVVLRRLAVFPGSFTLDAASAVASDDRIDDYAVIDVLSQLVARSLVVADPATSGARYRLLETTRAYALEKLVEVEETADIARRHAVHFRAFFERAPDDFLRLRDRQWHARYVPELEHVRAALDWALGGEGDAGIAVALAGASAPLWTVHSLYGEGTQRLEAAAAVVGANTPEPDEARLSLWLGLLTRNTSSARSLVLIERAVGLYRKVDYSLEIGHASVLLARGLAAAGRFDESAAALAEALPKLENSGIPKLLGLYHGSAATLNAFAGDPVKARSEFQKALSLYRDGGSEISALESIGNLADVSWTLGDLAGAEAALREYIVMRGSPFVRRSGLGNALGNLAGVLTEQG